MIDVEETRDLDLVRDILVSDDIWWRIAGADVGIGDFYPPEDIVYLLVRVDEEPAGLFIIKPDLDSHFQLLPQYRDQKYPIGAAVLSKAAEYTDRITTEISKEHPNVHYFALKNGYKLLKEDDTTWFYEKVL